MRRFIEGFFVRFHSFATHLNLLYFGVIKNLFKKKNPNGPKIKLQLAKQMTRPFSII